MILRLLITLLVATGLAAAAPHIVLVGDSTVTDNAGWGLGFRQFLADGVDLTNTSQGGRSSMSFIKEGRWEKALALKADYYLIQFGHNDQPGKPGRSTTAEEYRAAMTRYVDDARTGGAKPVLVTPLVRREFRDKQNPDRIISSLEPWARTVREIAREKNVPLVELHGRSKELCESMGREGVGKISPVKPDGQYDGTHLNSAAYVPFGRIVAQELEKAVPALAPFILDEPRDPHPRSGAKDFDAVVSFDGSGTHTTVQAAINAVPADTTAGKQFRILVKPGVYKEHVVIPADKKFIQLMGEPGEEQATVITMGTHVKTPDPAQPGKTLSAQDSSTVLIDAPDVTCRYLTFENTTTREDRVQALACFIRGDRVSFFNCRFLGWQDTLRPDSAGGKSRRQYFRDCYVEGHVDYIYAGGTAVFDRCTIHTKADGYITAASTAESTPFGFVFLDCKLTTGPGVEKGVYLGRPWRPAAHTAFIRCEMDGKILPAGWHNWGKAENEETARYYEFGSTGPGARPGQRVPWAKSLTEAEAEKWSAAAILNGDDGWNSVR
jgi:pectinesterase